MSCGKTTTRRQAHNKRRTTIFLGHTLGVPSGSGGAVTPKGRRVAVKKKILKRRTVTPAWLKAWDKAHPFKFNLKALQAWERRHPFTSKNSCRVKLRYAAFTKAQQAAWDKAHPFKPWTNAQWQAWFKSHP